MDQIGIICASDTELEPVLGYFDGYRVVERAMLKFYEGEIGNVPVVAVFSGVCKVNAAIAAQLMVDLFQVKMIVNVGTAGGMDAGVRLFDTVISERVAYHDVADDILTEFHPWLETVYFYADAGLINMVKEVQKEIAHPILTGSSVTGEQFIEEGKRQEINERFAPLSVDMETAAIAHVCYTNNVPFIAIRTITDTASHIGIDNFESNCERASAIAAEITTGLLEKFASLII